jgi:hypothetical protein
VVRRATADVRDTVLRVVSSPEPELKTLHARKDEEHPTGGLCAALEPAFGA